MKPSTVSMDLDDAILLLLASNDGEIDGRTTIQKLMFLSSLKTPIEGTDDYRPRYYGPFSANVAKSLELLVGLNFAEERPRVTSSDYVSYLYRLTDDGNELIPKLKNAYAKHYRQISDIVNRAREFCGLNPYVLSYAAKVYYILNQSGKPINEKDAANEGRKLKWQISERDAKSGIKLLLALDLAKEIDR